MLMRKNRIEDYEADRGLVGRRSGWISSNRLLNTAAFCGSYLYRAGFASVIEGELPRPRKVARQPFGRG